MAFRVGEDSFEIGIGNEAGLSARRFFNEPPPAIIDGYLIALCAVREEGADLSGEQEHLVRHVFALRSNDHMGAVIGLRMQPDVVGGSLAQQAVVLHVVSSDAHYFWVISEADNLIMLKETQTASRTRSALLSWLSGTE